MPINTTIPYSNVFVNPFDEDIWLAIHLQNGSANVTLNKAQAQELIDQLTNLVNPMARFDAAKSLQDLADRLNAWKPSKEGQEIEDVIDLTKLPVFGNEPRNLDDVWSWDDNNVLRYDTKKREWFVEMIEDYEPPEQDPEPSYRARNTYSLEELKGIL